MQDSKVAAGAKDLLVSLSFYLLHIRCSLLPFMRLSAYALGGRSMQRESSFSVSSFPVFVLFFLPFSSTFCPCLCAFVHLLSTCVQVEASGTLKQLEQTAQQYRNKCVSTSRSSCSSKYWGCAFACLTFFLRFLSFFFADYVVSVPLADICVQLRASPVTS